MNGVINFYDSLDLKYPEIGIAMEDIDRSNPGCIKFIIPVLTPYMDSTRLTTTRVHQVYNSLKNKKKNLEIENLDVTNYINIKVPREVCSVYGDYDDKIIPAGSKWIIVFVGGDITKPNVIAPYIE